MKKIGEIVEIDRARIRPFAGQPREYFNQAALKDLARSIKATKGNVVEIIVRPLAGDPKHDYELIDGQRRWLACGMIQIHRMRAVVRDVADANEQLVTSVVANFAREEHTPIEIAKVIARLRKHPNIAAIENREHQTQAVGDLFGRSYGWVYAHEKLLRLAPAIQKLLATNELGFRTAEMLSALPHAEQADCLRACLGRGRDAAVAFVRRWVSKAGGTQADGSRLPKRGASLHYAREGFLGAITALAERAEALLDMGAADFRRAFEGRPLSEHESAVLRIDRAIDQLETLREAVAGTLKRRKEAA